MIEQRIYLKRRQMPAVQACSIGKAFGFARPENAGGVFREYVNCPFII